MGIAVKVVVGLVLLVPMTAYVVHGLVAAANVPLQHDPIIVEQTHSPNRPEQSPSGNPTKKAGHDKKDDHGGGKGTGKDNGPGTVVITPSPEVFDDHGGLDNSGKGSGGGDDSSSGKGSGDD